MQLPTLRTCGRRLRACVQPGQPSDDHGTADGVQARGRGGAADRGSAAGDVDQGQLSGGRSGTRLPTQAGSSPNPSVRQEGPQSSGFRSKPSNRHSRTAALCTTDIRPHRAPRVPGWGGRCRAQISTGPRVQSNRLSRSPRKPSPAPSPTEPLGGRNGEGGDRASSATPTVRASPPT
jgi:hypothetical protein